MSASHNGDDSTSLDGLIDLYLLCCQVEGKSPNTVTAYAETLRLFERIPIPVGQPLYASRS